MAYTKPKTLNHRDLPVDGESRPGTYERSVARQAAGSIKLPVREIKMIDPTKGKTYHHILPTLRRKPE